MIHAFSIHEKRIVVDKINTLLEPPLGIIWLDIIEPDEEEEKWLSQYYPGALSHSEELTEIEVSSRFFESDRGVHIRSLFPHRTGHELRNVNIAFELWDDKLLTQEDEPTALFRLMRRYLKYQHLRLDNPIDILLTLTNSKIEYLADTLEEIYEALEKGSQNALADEASDKDALLKTITLQEDLNGKVRLSLLDTQRSLRYLMRTCAKKLSKSQYNQIREMLRDVDSLTPHTAFLFEKINFLLDATMGFINLEQNKIIKIFSVAAVIFLPPTLIASIYGMNFEWMPQIHQPYGFEISILLMVGSIVGSLAFFKGKGWL